jgi:putative ABC transport system substrate-binding protein
MSVLEAMKVPGSPNWMPTVSIIAAGAPGPIGDFRAGMRDRGFIAGRTVQYDARVAHGSADMLFPFAVELVAARVDLIAVIGAVTARAARDATKIVPIVYAVVVDPIGDGLATRSGQPLGNMTGLTTYDPDQARVQIALLRSVKPNLVRIAFLADSSVSDCLVKTNMRAAQEAGLRPQIIHISGPAPDLATAFEAMKREEAEALVVLEQPINGANAASIAELALARHMPTVVARSQADAGGLFGYGTSLRRAANQMAQQASRILHGTDPTDLPVETFHRPELVVNMRTALSLGITVPPEILGQAVRIIA